MSLVLDLGLEHSCPRPREGRSLASDFFLVLGLEGCVHDSTSDCRHLKASCIYWCLRKEPEWIFRGWIDFNVNCSYTFKWNINWCFCFVFILLLTDFVNFIMICFSAIRNAIVGNDDVWIGLTDSRNEGSFVWLDGERATARSIRWNSGEPNNENGNEDCVHINTNNRANDWVCNRDAHALCEKRLLPEICCTAWTFLMKPGTHFEKFTCFLEILQSYANFNML